MSVRAILALVACLLAVSVVASAAYVPRYKLPLEAQFQEARKMYRGYRQLIRHVNLLAAETKDPGAVQGLCYSAVFFLFPTHSFSPLVAAASHTAAMQSVQKFETRGARRVENPKAINVLEIELTNLNSLFSTVESAFKQLDTKNSAQVQEFVQLIAEFEAALVELY